MPAKLIRFRSSVFFGGQNSGNKKQPRNKNVQNQLLEMSDIA